MLKHGTAYVARGMDDYEQQYRDRAVKHLHRRAKELGYELHPAPEGAPASRSPERNSSLGIS